MLFLEIDSAPSLWLREKREELKVAQQRKMSEITANEQLYGRNITGLLLALVNSAFFPVYMFVNFFHRIILKPQLFAFFLLVAATPFQLGAIYFLFALHTSFVDSMFTFGSFVRSFLEPTVIEIADDEDEDVEHSIFNRYALLRAIDVVLGTALKLLHKIDSIIPNYLAAKKSVWGQEKANFWYNVYFASKMVAMTYVAFAYTPLNAVFTINENIALNYISNFALMMAPVLPQVAFVAPFIGVTMLSISLSTAISSIATFVVNERIKREHFIRDANTYSQDEQLEATKQMLAALENNDGARVLELYRTYEATHDESTALVKNNTTVFRAAAVDRRKYFKGTDLENMPSEDDENAPPSPIKTCAISYMTCQYPVYIKSVTGGAEYKHYYDLFNILTWLRDHDTNPLTNQKISLADIYYDAEAKQAIDALVAEEKQDNLSQQQAATTSAQNANSSCFQWLRCMSRQAANSAPQATVVNANLPARQARAHSPSMV